MRKKIEEKLSKIKVEMERIETFPNYCLHVQWQLLNAQRQALMEILVAVPERLKKDL